MHSTTKSGLALAALCMAFTAAPAALADDEEPSFTLNRDAFNAARNVELSTASREKLFADYASLWGGINRDGVVDDAEMAFLQSQIDSVPKVLLKGAATADWAPQDFAFNGNWSQVGGGGFDAPQVYLRARVAGWIAGKAPVSELAGQWPELTIDAAFYSALKESGPATQQPRDTRFGAALRSYMKRAQFSAAEQGRIAAAFYDGPHVILVRSEAGGEAFAFANVWERLGRIELEKMLPDADLVPLWTGEPRDILKLAGPHARSPEDAARVVDFLARQLAPLAAESMPANAWQPIRTFMAHAKARIKHEMPEAEQPAARQLLHDALKQVSATMEPPMPSTIYTFALSE